jgi:hypothetical protein
MLFVVVCLLADQVNAVAHACSSEGSAMIMQHAMTDGEMSHHHHDMVAEEPQHDVISADCCKTSCQCTQSGCSVSMLAIAPKQSFQYLTSSDRILAAPQRHLSLSPHPAFKPPITA